MITKEEIEFIRENIHENVHELGLKTHRFEKERMGFLLNQIKARQKTEKKLPSWKDKFELIFSSMLAAEQCSSDVTANYKSKIAPGKKMVDLTGGLGVDILAFSKTFDKCIHLERNKETQQAAAHNFKIMNAHTITSHCIEAETFLEESKEKFDLVYIDPARRQGERKVFDFSLCEPDVIKLQSLLKIKTEKIIIKASPMITIQDGLKQLDSVSEIHIISHKNECKEILFLQDFKTSINHIQVYCQELETEHHLSVKLADCNLGLSRGKGRFIFDPFVSYRKAGLAGFLGMKYHLSALTEEGTLLTGDTYIEEFPGRIFEIIEELDYSAKTLKKSGVSKAHIISRGYSQHSDEIRKKLKVKDGGDFFVFVYKNDKKKSKLLLCERR